MHSETTEKQIHETKVLVTNLKALIEGYRLIVNQGGTWSGKTFGFLIALAIFFSKTKDKRRALILGQTSDELREGALKDWETIMDMMPVGREINKTSRIWKVGNSTITFKSLDKPGKAKSGKRDIVFVNECNHIGWDIIVQLLMRCNTMVLDFNPTAKFWLHSKIIPKIDQYDPYLLTKTTYNDNPAVPESIIREIESHTGAFYDTYAKGELGRREGVIFDYVTHQVEPVGLVWSYFLDFGFTNDVTALGMAAIQGDTIYCKELIYETGLLTKQINDKMVAFGIPKNKPIHCDNIPKEVAELAQYGWTLIKTHKYAGSVLGGINILLQYKISLSASSVNAQEEFDNYEWLKKNNETVLPQVPIDKWNHFIDGLRYWTMANCGAGAKSRAMGKVVYGDNLM